MRDEAARGGDSLTQTWMTPISWLQGVSPVGARISPEISSARPVVSIGGLHFLELWGGVFYHPPSKEKV